LNKSKLDSARRPKPAIRRRFLHPRWRKAEREIFALV
jgi:hypothetical protein